MLKNINEHSPSNAKEVARGGQHIEAVSELSESEYQMRMLYNALKESEASFKKAQEVGHVGSWEYDIKNDTFRGSDEAKRIYGFDPVLDTFTAEEVMKCVIESDRVNQAMIDLITKNTPYNIVFDIISRNSNEKRTINSIAELVRDDQGNPLNVTGVLLDITDRTMAENRIKLSSQILSLLNSTTPFNETIDLIISHIQAAFGFDAVGIRVKSGDDYPYFSQNGFDADFLKTENTLIERTKQGGICTDKNGKPCLECTCGLVISGITDSTNPLFTEGGSFYTNDSPVLLGLTADQEPRRNPRNRCIHDGYQSVALIPIRHNTEIIGLLQLNDTKKDCFTPITVRFFEGIGEMIGVALIRKQAEDAVKISEREFRLLAESMPQIVWICNPDGMNIYFNQQWVTYTGLSLEESYGHGWNKPFHPDDQKRAWIAWQEAVQHGAPYALECRLGRADGEYKWWMIRGVPVYDPKGAVKKWFGTCTDIDELKQAEKEILTLNESLERRIRERTQQLEIINKELLFHLSELEQFSYVSNHDLQEPLRTLIHFTQLIKDKYAGKLDEEGNKYIDFITNAASRMKELVKDLMEYSLLGKECAVTTIDCNSIVEAVLVDLEVSIKKSNGRIVVQELPTINGYETELRLLFQNLIANAIKYQKQGNVPEIYISAKKHNNEWLFKVSDNGIGIDEKYREKIFIMFQRLHKRNEYEGTGIGLAHCKKIVELHGGMIWVESTPDIGSIFKFTIPEINHV